MDKKDRFRYFLEYLAFRGLFALLKAVPPSTGGALGRLIGRASGRRTRLAVANMRAAFPSVSAAEAEDWARRLWTSLGLTAWEFARSSKQTAEDFRRSVTVEGVEHPRASAAAGKPLLFFTAHYANWELASWVVPLSGFPVSVIARRMKNPYVDAFVNRLRARFGAELIVHKNAVKESFRRLRNGRALGLLFDQRITAGGVKVPFLGREAHTTTLPAILALRAGAAAHPVHSRRRNGRLHFYFGPAVDLSGLTTKEEDVIKATEIMNREVEAWIRAEPSAWLWIHDRWK